MITKTKLQFASIFFATILSMPHLSAYEPYDLMLSDSGDCRACFIKLVHRLAKYDPGKGSMHFGYTSPEDLMNSQSCIVRECAPSIPDLLKPKLASVHSTK